MLIHKHGFDFLYRFVKNTINESISFMNVRQVILQSKMHYFRLNNNKIKLLFTIFFLFIAIMRKKN